MDNYLNIAWQFIINTPWWVYLLLAYLIFIGIKASNTRIVSIKKLLIAPVIFTVLSLETLLTAFKITPLSVGTWIAAIIIGIGLGWLQIIRHKLIVDKPHLLIKVPGSWLTLILVLIIFVSKYYFGYQIAVDPQLETQTGFEISMLGVSGVCTGLFIGRVIAYFYRLNTEPSTNLSKPQNG